MAEILLATGKLDEAEHLNQEALITYNSSDIEGADLVAWLKMKTIRAKIYIAREDPQSAKKELEGALHDCRERIGENNVSILKAKDILASISE